MWYVTLWCPAAGHGTLMAHSRHGTFAMGTTATSIVVSAAAAAATAPSVAVALTAACRALAFLLLAATGAVLRLRRLRAPQLGIPLRLARKGLGRRRAAGGGCSGPDALA